MASVELYLPAMKSSHFDSANSGTFPQFSMPVRGLINIGKEDEAMELCHLTFPSAPFARRGLAEANDRFLYVSQSELPSDFLVPIPTCSLRRSRVYIRLPVDFLARRWRQSPE